MPWLWGQRGKACDEDMPQTPNTLKFRHDAVTLRTYNGAFVAPTMAFPDVELCIIYIMRQVRDVRQAGCQAL